jgi:hypothetical protein
MKRDMEGGRSEASARYATETLSSDGRMFIVTYN